jgi:hypothetical protein
MDANQPALLRKGKAGRQPRNAAAGNLDCRFMSQTPTG